MQEYKNPDKAQLNHITVGGLLKYPEGVEPPGLFWEIKTDGRISEACPIRTMRMRQEERFSARHP